MKEITKYISRSTMNLKIKKKYLIIIAFVFLSGGFAFSCTNFLISKGATKDGSTMITYAADSHVLYGELYFWAREKHGKKDSLKIYEWDTGKLLGKIKQTELTYKVVGNMNEHQLAIGETTYGGREELVDTTGILDYGSLIYIALQRAKTAREAILLMDELLSEYGYYSSGESFSIADPNEVWIMELIGKGVGNKGAVWVARKIPDGYISGHANQSRITTFPLKDKDNCLYSDDVISFAREKGYFSGEDKDFSFADAYAPLDFGGARFCEARVWSGFNKVNSNMAQYLDYAMGTNLKNRMLLWVKPDSLLSLSDVIGIMRDYFQNSPMDMTKDIGAGPYECIVRWRPLTWEIEGKTYFNERAISTQQTGFSFVAQCRDWLPNPVGGILWFGVDDTYTTVYNPVYCGINKVPFSLKVGNGSMMEFSDGSAFWIFNQVSNFAYTRYNAMIPIIQNKQASLENGFFGIVSELDKKIKANPKYSEEDLSVLATELSINAVEKTFMEWKMLYQKLFVTFMDGNIKTPNKTPENHNYVNPTVEQPGYSKDWYKEIIKGTNEKFIYHGPVGH